MAVKVKVAQLCLTLCALLDYTVHENSPDGNTGVDPSSKGSSQPREPGWTQVSCIEGGFFTSWTTREAQESGLGSLSLLQQIFRTQKSNQGLLHCRWILYQLSYQGSPSRSVVSDSLQPHGLYSPWSSPDWNTGVGSLSLLQGILTQGSNPGLLHCRQILYQLSHKAVQIYIPTSCVGGFPFLCILSNICYFWMLTINRCEVISHCCLWFAFLC